jgi:arylsulfatase
MKSTSVLGGGLSILTAGVALLGALGQVWGQEVLPFPPQPSGSTAGLTMQESTYNPLPAPSHLPKDAPTSLLCSSTMSAPHRRILTAVKFIRRH